MYSSVYSDSYCTGWSWVDEAPGGTNNVTVSYKSDFGNLFVMAGDGNVGVGTGSPTQKLEVNGNLLVGSPNYNNSNSPIIRLGHQSADLANGSQRGVIQFDSIQDVSVNVGDAWKWKIATVARPGNVGNYNSQFEILRTTRSGVTDNTDFCISRSGNVGIGTTNPTSKLQVEGELNTKGGAVHEVFDVLNINPAGTVLDSIGNNSDGGATSWQVVGSRVVDLFNTSGAHAGTWGFPLRINTAGWYKLRIACRLSSTNGFIHANTLPSNYKFNIGFSFGFGTVGIDSDPWDVDTLGNGTRVAKIGSAGYLNVGTYQMTYYTSGYLGIKQIYIYSLELIRVG
jgi:hypothetical protein